MLFGLQELTFLCTSANPVLLGLQEVTEQLASIGADSAPARAATLLSNLGFSDDLAKRSADTHPSSC